MQQQLQPVTAPKATLIPEDIARLAEEQQLGVPQADYTVLRLPRGWRWFTRAIWVVVCGDILALCAILIWFVAFWASTPSDLTFQFLLLPLVFSHLVFLSLRMILSNYSLYACEHGLILKQSAKKLRVIRWGEMQSIQTTFAQVPGSFFARHGVYTLRCYDGYTLTFSAARWKLSSLETFLEEHFTHPRLSLALESYQAGQTLHFGPLDLQCDGIAFNDQLLPWEQISDITLYQRSLLISKQSNPTQIWLKLPGFQIPNLALLLALCQRIRSGQDDPVETVSPVLSTITTVMSNRKWIDPLPEEIATLAAEYDLGERRVDEGLGQTKAIPLWLFLLGYGIMDGFFLGFILFLHFLFSSLIDIPDIPAGIELLPWFLLAGIVLFNIISLCSVFWHLPHATYTFAKGLICKNGRRAPGVYRWDEIDNVQDTFLFQKYFFYWTASLPRARILQRHDGCRLLLSNIDISAQALTTIIKEQIVPLQLQKALAAFEESQTLSFGLLHLNQAGISLAHRQLPWSQVRSVGLRNSGLHTCELVIYSIDRQGPWWRVSTTRVPNLALLCALADHARSSNTPLR